MGDLICGRIRPCFGFVLCVSLSFGLAAPVITTAQSLPPGASPGAQQPREDMRDRLPREQQDFFAIPPVIDRPLDIDEGPRIVVRRFEISGAMDREDYGISVAEVRAIADRQLATQPAEGFTINQLQVVADEIAKYYREAGLILAQAFVPEQTAEGGVVTLSVLEGKLGGIEVEGNAIYSYNRIIAPFAKYLGGPVVQGEIETALLYLSDLPGLTVFGVFSPGQDVGTTKLVLRVRDEDRFDINASADNYGTDFTGEKRGQVAFGFNNLAGAGDRLGFYVIQNFDPSDGTYGGINYDLPIKTTKHMLGVGYSRNDYDIGQQLQALAIEGDTDIINGYYRHSFIRKRNGNMYGLVDFSRKSATIEQLGEEIALDELSVFTAEFGFDYIDTRFQGINQGAIRFHSGLDDFLGSMDSNGDGMSSRRDIMGNFAGGDFDKWTFNFQRFQRITDNNNLLLRIEGQHSDDLLTSLEQFAVGGASSVRAYAPSEVLFDKGGFASLEWIINAPGFSQRPAFANRTWGEVFQVSLFYDYGGGKLNDPLPNEEESVDIHGWGGALQLSLPGKFLARLDIASPVSDRDPSNDDDPQYYFRFNYEF